MILGALEGLQGFLLFYYTVNLFNIDFPIFQISTIIGNVIYPIILLYLFLAMYLVGRRFDLKVKLRSTIILLFLGSYLGTLFGFYMGPLIAGYFLGLSYFEGWVLSFDLPYGLIPFFYDIFPFLIAFTGLSIAYIRNLAR